MTILSLQHQFIRAYCEFHPTTSTSLGFTEFNTQLADFSPQSIRSYLAQLKKINSDLLLLKKSANLKIQNHFCLSPDDHIDLALMESKILLERQELLSVRTHERDPSVYVGEVIYGLWYLMMRPFAKSEKLRGILGRLESTPALFAQAHLQLKKPPQLWLSIAQEEMKGLFEFFKDAQKELVKEFPKARAELVKKFSQATYAANQFQKYLIRLKKNADGDFAAGTKQFSFLLKNYHGFSQSPEQILKTGQTLLEKTLTELEEQAQKIDKKSSWKQLILQIKKTHPSQKNLLSSYRSAVLQTQKFIRAHHLVSIPKGEKLQVIKTPVFTRSTIPFAAYIDPPLFAKGRTGTFFVTPVESQNPTMREKLLQEHSTASLSITALHEGYPGHHLQFVYQANLTRPIRKIFNCSSYYEGWALYCEEMMFEEGFYSPPARLLQLKDRLWRACRVIVDVGMHTQGMSDGQATDFLSHKAKMAKASARADINWYTKSPTVPMSYLLGMLKIKELRGVAERKWGEKFSLQKFHEWFLGFGAIPLVHLEKALEEERV